MCAAVCFLTPSEHGTHLADAHVCRLALPEMMPLSDADAVHRESEEVVFGKREV